ncbi:MAG TPA: OmpW family outer membrane protein [Flavobacterium sp.]|uniref:OmpW/AlkL family protein n=1 Tax=unclassified Flavobacterium TaxID=196869 RepID=UPI000E8E5FDD|nr:MULTISPECIES: OmpW family outer membrane protein [unclassified Flavobacterium]HBI01472.1 OmpW family protein [Flavobacterium sp.]HRE76601.1 OmpW family outer membrane protein [Flavobacterium sp.]
MKKIVYALVTMSLFVTTFTQAQEEKSNDFKRWQVRLRGIGVVPNESAKIGIIGGDVAISNALVPELDFTYFFTENFAAELILGTAKHDVNTVGSDISAIGGPTSFNVDLGSVMLLPPTLTAQYHFFPLKEKKFKPYVGAGVNYTLFYNVKEGDIVKGIEYENAIGFAAQIGFDVMFDDTFFVNFDVKRLFLKTDVTVDATNLAEGLVIPAEVEINPWIVGLGFGMKF